MVLNLNISEIERVRETCFFTHFVVFLWFFEWRLNETEIGIQLDTFFEQKKW